MHRNEAINKLKRLEGQDLHNLASEFGITVVSASGNVNKGWAGHVCERYLGLPINSSQSPNFGSWELKSIPLKRLANGSLSFKETMAITMIDDYHVKKTPFEESHLLAKLRKAVIVCLYKFKNVTNINIKLPVAKLSSNSHKFTGNESLIFVTL